jgi:DnaK suppressor protein
MRKRAPSKPVKTKAVPKPAKKAKAAAKPLPKSAARPAARAKAPVKPAAKPPMPAPKPKATVRAAGKAPDKKLTAKAPRSSIVLSPDYRPSEDEPFMNEMHRMYFRQKLMNWKEEIIRQTKETLAGLHEDSTQHADLADRATSETDRALELRARDRQRKLIAKIDAALARIEDGTYGYCEETGEPIGLKRLDARPIATLSLEAQERHERRERVYRED